MNVSKTLEKAKKSIPMKDSRNRLISLSALGLCILILILLTVSGAGYGIRLVTIAAIGVVLALGLNICYGICGQINFGVAAFYAVGAYAATLLQSLGVHFFLALPISILFGFASAFAIAVPLLRLKGHTLALGTVALALVVFAALVTFRDLTGGVDGLTVSRVQLFGYRLGRAFFMWFAVLAAVLSYIVANRLEFSRAGRAMKSIRLNENTAAALGIDVTFYKRLAFAINGAYAALAGVLLANATSWIGVEYFELYANVLVLIMVCFGGVGSNAGSALGGAVIMLLPEGLAVFKEYKGLVYGLILVLCIRFMPAGVAGVARNIWQSRQRKLETLDPA